MKILLAIDCSSASEAAIKEVASRPWPAGTSVEVLSAVETPHAWSMSEVMEDLSRRTGELVHLAAERLCGAGLAATTHVAAGDPKAAIIDRAAAIRADLVIVASHGTRGVTRFLMGSVTQAVVRFAPCSVEVVRPFPIERGAGGMKILLAADGSDASAEAARSIAARPWPADTEVRIFSVVELALTDLQAAFEPPIFDAQEKEKIREDAMRKAQEAIAHAEELLAAVELKTSENISVLVGAPKEIILEEAKNFGADLIVVGSHGHRGLSRFMLGSTSEAVAAHAECSVEVIRVAGRE